MKDKDAASQGKEFFKNGIRFECQGEGKCCVSRGSYGYVYLSFNDRRRLAAHFKMSTAEFTAKYAEKEDVIVITAGNLTPGQLQSLRRLKN